MRERQFKKQRREGGITLHGEWIKSILLPEREKWCLTPAWTRRGARVAKHFKNHKSYLKDQVQEVADRIKKNEVRIRRLRNHLVGKVNDFLFNDDQDDRGAEDSSAAGGETPSQGEREAACEISDAYQARLYLQAVIVLDVHARLMPRIFQAREG